MAAFDLVAAGSEPRRVPIRGPSGGGVIGGLELAARDELLFRERGRVRPIRVSIGSVRQRSPPLVDRAALGLDPGRRAIVLCVPSLEHRYLLTAAVFCQATVPSTDGID